MESTKPFKIKPPHTSCSEPTNFKLSNQLWTSRKDRWDTFQIYSIILIQPRGAWAFTNYLFSQMQWISTLAHRLPLQPFQHTLPSQDQKFSMSSSSFQSFSSCWGHSFPEAPWAEDVPVKTHMSWNLKLVVLLTLYASDAVLKHSLMKFMPFGYTAFWLFPQ